MPLTDVEQHICKTVVRRFLDQNEATPRSALLKSFKGSLSGALQTLLDRAVLRVIDPTNQTYVPRAIAFHYCGDNAALAFARKSTELVLRVVYDLFDRELENESKDQKQFTPGDAEIEARAIDSSAEPSMIWVGLCLAEEFGVFYMMQRDARQVGVAWFKPSERIYEVMKDGNAWDEHIRRSSVSVERAWEKRHSESSLIALPSDRGLLDVQNSILGLHIQPKQEISRKIFLVHGHAEKTKQDVATFLKTLDLDVVILHEKANEGQTIVEKFEKHSDVGFAVVLLTPDDVGASANEPEKTKRRARQNVILELGYFIGKLGRNRVCPLYIEEVELPSDIHGVLYVPYDASGAWHSLLVKEINAAGIKVDSKEVL
jgi:hypothetical protein